MPRKNKEYKQLMASLEEIKKKYPPPEDTGSEFGKGLIYNLILFSMHFANDQAKLIRQLEFLRNQTPEDIKLIMSPDPPPNKDYGNDLKHAIFYWKEILPMHKTPEDLIADQINLWANGASDHLYEIQVPEIMKDTKLEKKILELKELGLEMGHGNGLFGQYKYNVDDFSRLIDLTKEISIAIDKMMGVDVIKGTWE